MRLTALSLPLQLVFPGRLVLHFLGAPLTKMAPVLTHKY